MTCANVLVGRVKDCEGIEIGRCWMGGRRCGYLRHSRRLCILTYFNPRSREGSDGITGQGRCCGTISIHAPVKGATSRYPHAACCCTISIHTPVKGATVCRIISHGVTPISIHAPAKGATRWATQPLHSTRISIHAPVKGATQPSECDLHRYSYFNPRSREGSDRHRPC